MNTLPDTFPIDPEADQALRIELDPTVGGLLDRHLSLAKPWYPHELINWDAARDFGEHPWSPDDNPLADAVRSSLYVNLLTEDNLPYYTETLLRGVDPESAWAHWIRRWTAEENRHSTVIRDYIITSRAVDPVLLEDGRMAQMERAETPQFETFSETNVYTAIQEPATQTAHFNTAKKTDDEFGGKKVMRRVGADEGMHGRLYLDTTVAGFSIDPSTMMKAVYNRVKNFEMPGTGIIDFANHARAIARAGIFSIPIFYDEVLHPVVATWDIDNLSGLDAEAEQAREALNEYMSQLGRVAMTIREREAERNERAELSS